MDKLRALRYFLKVAQTTSFSGAAKAFAVPASSVSRRIQDLEQELGIELFYRSTRVVKLTALGQVYHDYVQEAVTALDHADEIVGQHSLSPSGILKLTAMPGYGTVRLLPALHKFREMYPNIVLDVELTDQVTDLVRDQTDIAIRASAKLPDRLVARRLSGNRFVLVASNEYAQKFDLPKTIADLQDHPALLYRGPNGVLHWQACRDGEWTELQMQPAFISNDGAAILNAAKSGQGLALLPEWGLVNELVDGSLVEIVLDDGFVSVTRATDSGIFLLYNRPKYGLKKVRVAVDFLVRELSMAI